jgi:hypothetical protein
MFWGAEYACSLSEFYAGGWPDTAGNWPFWYRKDDAVEYIGWIYGASQWKFKLVR